MRVDTMTTGVESWREVSRHGILVQANPQLLRTTKLDKYSVGFIDG